MMRRRPPLPAAHHAGWWAFLDCAEVLEAGRRQLLATLPAGRVDPAPVGLGLDRLEATFAGARAWMPRWQAAAPDGWWEACARAIEEAAAALPHARDVAEATDELEDLLGAIADVVAPLDAFGDAERAWRRQWRVPATRPGR